MAWSFDELFYRSTGAAAALADGWPFKISYIIYDVLNCEHQLFSISVSISMTDGNIRYQHHHHSRVCIRMPNEEWHSWQTMI